MTQRPVLRYHGGKWMLARWIIAHLPPHRIYVEPYGGAASVLIRKPRSYSEIYNDLDGEVVNVFRVLRDQDKARRLRELIILTPFARDEFAMSYDPHADDIEQARRTIARSFMGFGSTSASGYRTGFRNNSNLSGTTPAHDWKHLPRQFRFWVKRMRGVVIENKPAVEVMRQCDKPGALHYVDPPYVPESRNTGNAEKAKGYRHEMTPAQHVELAEVLHGLTGMVVLSGYRNRLYEDLYRDWKTVERQALGDGACKRTEVLWFNDAAWKASEAGKGLFA
jgi:DNA adenine methylase